MMLATRSLWSRGCVAFAVGLLRGVSILVLGVHRMKRSFCVSSFVPVVAFLLLIPGSSFGQSEPRCRLFCAPELKIEPTWTIENLASRPRIESNGQVERAA